MERFTEKFKDGRNILRKGIADIFHVGFGRFFEGDAINKLAEYEDLEEQGKLLKLPCAVGDTIFRINKGAKNPIISMEIHEISMFCTKTNNLVIQIKCHDDIDSGETFCLTSEIGETVFLTKEEAEAILKEMSE